jgi:hypothetical protein
VRRPRPLRLLVTGGTGRQDDRKALARGFHPAGRGEWGPPAASIVHFSPKLRTAEVAVAEQRRHR